MKHDEADVLFGAGNGNKVPEVEAEFIFAMQASEVPREEKIRLLDGYRAASSAEKDRMHAEVLARKIPA